ncbi:DUF393 domain-containing protein [Motiliproteus coralliicola]|uniref:DUF393 domain-containing protein n=1 Tax=Motiliproteus coralliicola TaxID=2283196 RepID=A0A369WDY0_9GAMM|nr:DUF393 domain-containing protein [Motiliproteus coralliicola]RDE19531.1 DUF393 domain-containing protein [Motiliproteus coralliicola]
MSQGDQPIKVFYDGACPRCVQDRRNYEQLDSGDPEQVCWVDITDREAELERLGIDPNKALTELHLMTADGRILSELDAYIVLMRRVRWLKPMAWLIGLPGIRPLLSRGYRYTVTRRLQRSGRLPE